MAVARQILYPELRVNGILIPRDSFRINVAQAKNYLGWEDEETFEARTGKKLDDSMFIIQLDNLKRATCHNSTRNRPFYERHARRIGQDILNKCFAGPSAMPFLKTPNCETVIIGESGQVLSANHRLVGLVFAHEWWKAKNPEHKWHQNWPDGPVIDALVVTGCDEHPNLIRTLDNVKPRSASDVFFTSPFFEKLDRRQRQECSRMMEVAVAVLWNRTGANDRMGNPAHYHRTNSEAMNFVSNHERLMECINHIFRCNRDRVLSLLRLSSGEAAAALYMMGCCDSDGDFYRFAEPPCEELLKWDRWEDAKKFWTLLSQKSPKVHTAIKDCISSLDSNEINSSVVKSAILAKAWIAFLSNGRVENIDLALEYQRDKNGKNVLVERPIFGNIDLGDKPAYRKAG